jgi:hypothetical protein
MNGHSSRMGQSLLVVPERTLTAERKFVRAKVRAS